MYFVNDGSADIPACATMRIRRGGVSPPASGRGDLAPTICDDRDNLAKVRKVLIM